MRDRLYAFWTILKGMNRRIGEANLSLAAAGGAFFAMLSLFPALAALISLLGFFIDPGIVDDQLAMLKDFVPRDAFDIIDVQVRLLADAHISTLSWATAISIGTALWSARSGAGAMIHAVNAAYEAPVRGGVWSAIAAFLITLALILVGIVSILTLVVLPIVLAFLPLGAFSSVALNLARWIIAVTVVLSGIWVLYRFSPNIRNARIRWISPGSVLSILVWGIASWGFSYYLSNFRSYNDVYGSIGAVVALLMFLYISIFIVLLGATLNAELSDRRHKERAARVIRQTPGPNDRPTGADTGGAVAPVMLGKET